MKLYVLSYRKSCVSHELVVAKQLISGHAFVQFRRSNYEKYPLAAAEKMPPSWHLTDIIKYMLQFLPCGHWSPFIGKPHPKKNRVNLGIAQKGGRGGRNAWPNCLLQFCVLREYKPLLSHLIFIISPIFTLNYIRIPSRNHLGPYSLSKYSFP